MDSAISSDWTVRVAFAVGCLLIFFTLMLFCMVFFLRFSLVKRQQRQKAFIEVWSPIWNACLSGETPSNVPVLRATDANTFLVQWIQFHETYGESMQDALNGIAEKTGVERYLMPILKRHTIREKVLALTAMGFLRKAKYWEPLWQHAMAENTFISLASARAMLHLDATKAMPFIIGRIIERPDWPQARVSLFLAEAGIDVVSAPLCSAAQKAPPEHAPRIIRYLEVAAASVALPTLNEILKSAKDKEVVLACLNTMIRFVPRNEIETIYPFLEHPDWEIRAAAVKAVGRVADPLDEVTLLKRLNDSQNIVQYEAAQALFRLPQFNLERCLKIQQRMAGQPGSLVLTRVMTEKQLKP